MYGKRLFRKPLHGSARPPSIPAEEWALLSASEKKEIANYAAKLEKSTDPPPAAAVVHSVTDKLIETKRSQSVIAPSLDGPAVPTLTQFDVAKFIDIMHSGICGPPRAPNTAITNLLTDTVDSSPLPQAAIQTQGPQSTAVSASSRAPSVLHSGVHTHFQNVEQISEKCVLFTTTPDSSRDPPDHVLAAPAAPPSGSARIQQIDIGPAVTSVSRCS